MSNITQIINDAGNQLAKTQSFAYDDLYRLTGSTTTDDYLATTTIQAFDYDIIGNITNKSDVGNYSYGNDNPYQASTIDSQNYTYDDNGNLANDGTRTMSYNYQDMMSTVTIGARSVNYYYDHTKNRVAKYNPQSGYTKFYPNRYFEKDSSDQKTRYVFLGNQRIAIVERQGTSTPEVLLNFSDHLNSSSVTTDEEGNITNLIDYLPFGEERVNVSYSSSTPDYLFTDQEYDDEADQYYFKARFYGQNVGRFNGQDPLQLQIAAISDDEFKTLTGKTLPEYLANPQGLNTYAYAFNNPIRYIDPFGLWNKKTGEVEEGDTLSAITVEINEIYGTDYTYEQIASLSGIEDPNKIYVGDIIKPNEQIPDITVRLNEINESISESLRKNGVGYIELGVYYEPHGPGDFKWQKGIFCQRTECGGQQHASFVYNGIEVSGDAPANISFGYVGHSLGLKRNILITGATALQNLTNAYNIIVFGTKAVFPTIDSADNAYIIYGYNLYGS